MPLMRTGIDVGDRLLVIKEIGPGSTSPSIFAGRLTYDNPRGVTHNFTVPGSPVLPDVAASFGYRNDNSLVTTDGQAVTTEDDGNMQISRLGAGAPGDATMLWDARNPPTSVTIGGSTTSYTYDEEGRRLSKRTESELLACYTLSASCT